MSLPRVLIIDEALRRRLALAEALREGHELELLAPGDSGLRAVRRGRFALVLLCVDPDPSDALRQARAMRADFSPPPLVGLLDPGLQLEAPAALLSPRQAQGVYQGEVNTARVQAFVRALLDGEQPVSAGPPRPGLLQRLWARRRG